MCVIEKYVFKKVKNIWLWPLEWEFSFSLNREFLRKNYPRTYDSCAVSVQTQNQNVKPEDFKWESGNSDSKFHNFFIKFPCCIEEIQIVLKDPENNEKLFISEIIE